jgi:TatD DNase family protein
MPLERMLIESESPFMVPAAYRGKRNKPSYLGETAAFIAEMREIPVEEFAETIYRNALTVFDISE